MGIANAIDVLWFLLRIRHGCGGSSGRCCMSEKLSGQGEERVFEAQCRSGELGIPVLLKEFETEGTWHGTYAG
jgi:hypothetical protein